MPLFDFDIKDSQGFEFDGGNFRKYSIQKFNNDIKGKMNILYEPQYIITQCMKKILDEKFYLKYKTN